MPTAFGEFLLPRSGSFVLDPPLESSEKAVDALFPLCPFYKGGLAWKAIPSPSYCFALSPVGMDEMSAWKLSRQLS